MPQYGAVRFQVKHDKLHESARAPYFIDQSYLGAE